MRNNMRVLFISCAVWIGLSLNAGAALWTDNLNQALKQADRSNKYVLVNFAGSDWCGWCMRLDEEVFSQPAFKQYAAKELVLVLIDFPRHKEQPDKQKNANHALAKNFKVEGLPTIILLNAKGDVVAKTGYKPGGAQAYIKHLSTLINDYEAKAAEKSQSALPQPSKP